MNDLQTPAFLVDRTTVVRNCDAMREKASRSDVLFRPHVKTHKTLEIGRMQHGGSVGPITVSTLAEAEFFARGGFRDITYAVPIDPSKLERAASLAREIDLHLLIDSREAFDTMRTFAKSHGVCFSVFLKIDCGYHRAGVDPDDPQSVKLARDMASAGELAFRGVLTHAGHSYHARNRDEILEIAKIEADAVSRFAKRVGGRDLIRSVGSTPTASVVDRFPAIDEVRPGNYVFYDAFQSTIGSCELRDVAVSVLTSVIGNHPEEQKLLVDAGALALSKDVGPDHVDPEFGYGVVCDLALRPLPMRIVALSQEHGKIFANDGVDLSAFPIGTRLRIIPNHSCLTAAMFDTYHVIEKGSVVDEWHPVRGW